MSYAGMSIFPHTFVDLILALKLPAVERPLRCRRIFDDGEHEHESPDSITGVIEEERRKETG